MRLEEYLPATLPGRVVEPGAFRFSAIGLEHDHIFSMCAELMRAGATLVSVWDDDPAKRAAFVRAFPQAAQARSEQEVLDDASIQLVASAAVPAARSALGIRAMRAGKDVLVDKPPMTTLEQVAQVREAVVQTARKYIVLYGERMDSEAGAFADTLLRAGAIGKLIHMTGLGPHRLAAAQRADWFFRRETAGGILCDLGSHQIEHFLHYTGAADASITGSRVANYAHPQYPGWHDFGDATLVAAGGQTLYFRVDWFTPDGLGTWGDVRALLLGTEGYLELRKTTDIAAHAQPDTVLLVDRHGEHRINVHGRVGKPFYGALIRDCLRREETAVTQAHVLRVAELSIQAETMAMEVTPCA